LERTRIEWAKEGYIDDHDQLEWLHIDGHWVDTRQSQPIDHISRNEAAKETTYFLLGKEWNSQQSRKQLKISLQRPWADKSKWRNQLSIRKTCS
jgi:hypothetical protein